jgi:hypothetical protein
MAQSPTHKFGQYLGVLLERLFLPEIQAFCQRHDLYLDAGGERLVRKGSKLRWEDKYGNSHDLDFVVERNGGPDRQGLPVAFIEAAWRRYTKHSKNKAQEIQGAVLPIAERFQSEQPFLGAVLAGEFTKPSLSQLMSVGFALVYIPYNDIVSAFIAHGVDISFDENTSEARIEGIIKLVGDGGDGLANNVIGDLRSLHRIQFEDFFRKLSDKIVRRLAKVSVVPLYGLSNMFLSVDSAVKYISNDIPERVSGCNLSKIEITVLYSNGDEVRVAFASRRDALAFLSFAEQV